MGDPPTLANNEGESPSLHFKTHLSKRGAFSFGKDDLRIVRQPKIHASRKIRASWQIIILAECKKSIAQLSALKSHTSGPWPPPQW